MTPALIPTDPAFAALRCEPPEPDIVSLPLTWICPYTLASKCDPADVPCVTPASWITIEPAPLAWAVDAPELLLTNTHNPEYVYRARPRCIEAGHAVRVRHGRNADRDELNRRRRDAPDNRANTSHWRIVSCGNVGCRNKACDVVVFLDDIPGVLQHRPCCPRGRPLLLSLPASATVAYPGQSAIVDDQDGFTVCS